MELLIEVGIVFYDNEDLKTTDIQISTNVDDLADVRRFIALNLQKKIMEQATIDLNVERKELEKEFDFSFHGNDFLELVRQNKVLWTLNRTPLTFEDLYGCSEEQYLDIYGD